MKITGIKQISWQVCQAIGCAISVLESFEKVAGHPFEYTEYYVDELRNEVVRHMGQLGYRITSEFEVELDRQLVFLTGGPREKKFPAYVEVSVSERMFFTKDDAGNEALKHHALALGPSSTGYAFHLLESIGSMTRKYLITKANPKKETT